jgi:hypothetical protein
LVGKWTSKLSRIDKYLGNNIEINIRSLKGLKSKKMGFRFVLMSYLSKPTY